MTSTEGERQPLSNPPVRGHYLGVGHAYASSGRLLPTGMNLTEDIHDIERRCELHQENGHSARAGGHGAAARCLRLRRQLSASAVISRHGRLSLPDRAARHGQHHRLAQSRALADAFRCDPTGRSRRPWWRICRPSVATRAIWRATSRRPSASTPAIRWSTVVVTASRAPSASRSASSARRRGRRRIPYRQDMTLLDVMIQVGGLTDFADGNARRAGARQGRRQAYSVRLKDLIKRGDISANVDVQPGRCADHSAVLVLSYAAARSARCATTYRGAHGGTDRISYSPSRAACGNAAGSACWWLGSSPCWRRWSCAAHSRPLRSHCTRLRRYQDRPAAADARPRGRARHRPDRRRCWRAR